MITALLTEVCSSEENGEWECFVFLLLHFYIRSLVINNQRLLVYLVFNASFSFYGHWQVDKQISFLFFSKSQIKQIQIKKKSFYVKPVFVVTGKCLLCTHLNWTIHQFPLIFAKLSCSCQLSVQRSWCTSLSPEKL